MAAGTSPPADAAPAERAEIAAAKKLVADRMKDPTSVLYKEVVFLEDKKVVCGQYNGKNEFGGYAGFGKFTVSADGSLHTYNGSMCGGVPRDERMSCLSRTKKDVEAILENCSSVWPEE